jgi:hypothetical protein
VAVLGVTLATPASSEAGPFRWRRSYYVEPSNCCPNGTTVEAPGYSAGYFRTGSGYFSGYYRVGNVIINGRRWGDIGSRNSHADLNRW